MYGFSCLMLVFGILILIAGIYLYTFKAKDKKHSFASVLLWKVPDITKLSNAEIKKAGKWTMIISIIPFALAIIGLFYV